MKAKVDLEKFICSYVKWNNIQDALKDQGLKCWNGEIIEIPQDSEDERIKKEILDLISISGNGNQFEEIKDWLEYKPQGKTALEAAKEENVDNQNNKKLIQHISGENQGEQKHHEYTLEQAAGIFLDALSNTPYNNKPITDAQFITKELLKFLEDASSYNPDAINEQKLANFAKPCKNDTILDLLQKMPSCITVDGIDYHFVMKKTSIYLAYYACYNGNGEDGRGNAIFGITAHSPIDLLTEMLEILKEKGLLK